MMAMIMIAIVVMMALVIATINYNIKYLNSGIDHVASKNPLLT